MTKTSPERSITPPPSSSHPLDRYCRNIIVVLLTGDCLYLYQLFNSLEMIITLTTLQNINYLGIEVFILNVTNHEHFAEISNHTNSVSKIC